MNATNKMKLIRTIMMVAVALLACIAQAQEHGPNNPSLPVAHGTPIPLVRAVVVRYENDGTIELQETGKKAQRVKLAVQPFFFAPDGKMLDPHTVSLKPGVKVLVHYMPDGNQMIADRLILE
jgi:hypothetical protein